MEPRFSDIAADQATEQRSRELMSSPDPSLLAHAIGAPLTVIKGHAQLIRRRAKARDDGEAAALERSIAAIELAVQTIVAALPVTVDNDIRGDIKKRTEQT